MKIPEDVKEAINEMFLCKNLMEHMGCFQHFYEELKDCTFVVFSEDEGTMIQEDCSMEVKQYLIRGVASDKNVAKITFKQIS